MKTNERKYQRVDLKDLRQGRRGKHHEVVGSILEELAALPDGQAIKIPLRDISINNLRGAISRGSSLQNLKIASYSEGEYLYVWKKTKKSAQYERKIKQTGQ